MYSPFVLGWPIVYIGTIVVLRFWHSHVYFFTLDVVPGNGIASMQSSDPLYLVADVELSSEKVVIWA